jgi:hypothetical protein
MGMLSLDAAGNDESPARNLDLGRTSLAFLVEDAHDEPSGIREEVLDEPPSPRRWNEVETGTNDIERVRRCPVRGVPDPDPVSPLGNPTPREIGQLG